MTVSRTVVVEGVEIPEALIAQEAQNHPSLSAADAWNAAAHALAVKTLLLSRARALGLEASPEFDGAGREETEEEALIRAVLDTEVEIETPTEAECRRVYEARPDRFRTPPLYEAAHILVTPRDDSEEAVEAARQVAEKAIVALRDRRATFAELAGSLSDCTSASVGGSLGQLQRGDLAPEVETALLAQAPGAIAAEPVRSRFGWHVLKLERLIEGRDLPFEYVEDKIRLHLETRAWAAAAARYAAGLAEQAQMHGVGLSLAPDGGVTEGSLVLGDLLGAGEVAARAEAWLAAADPALAERVIQASLAKEIPIPDLIQQAVADFVNTATDERWTQLISAAQGGGDPALAAISNILRSKLEPVKQSFTVIRRRGG